ncbi:MAG: exosortase/archaeosortase family protein [Chthoniobacterales bacterium]
MSQVSAIAGPTGPAAAADEPSRRSALAFFGSLVAVWLLVSYRLSFIWESSDQYSHGWFVPLLGGWIFWRRWMTRPDPDPPTARSRTLLVALLGFLLLPIAVANLVLESSPDWRMMMYVLSGAAFLASLALTQLAGGVPWRRHLSFAFLFFLVAVPWPYDFETWLTVELSIWAARITTTLLNSAGILAVCDGNIIQLASGVLGVEDACSGVRSFQSSFVVAMLLGEWFRLRAGWRVFLCLLGLIVAYALNIGRMLLLSLVAEASGVGAIESWHDPAGFAILVATLGILWLVCFGLGLFPGTSRPERPASVLGAWGGLPSMVPTGVGVALALLLVLASVEGWYRSHEQNQAPVLTWSLVGADPAAGQEDVSLGDSVARGLGYDAGFRRAWKDSAGQSWELIYMRWEPGRKAATAGPHAPDYCQKAVGRTVLAKSETRTATVGQIVVPYQIYTIARGGRTFYLLFLLDDGRRDGDWMAAGLMGGGSSRERRLRQVREGRRNTGQTSLQLALIGVEDSAKAEEAMLRMLPSLLAPSP